MKILYFGGGLGNQIFEYAFYLYLKQKYPNEKIIGYYNRKKLNEHNGLEIDKWFQVELPKTKWYAAYICTLMYFLKKINYTKYIDIYNRDFVNTNAIVINAYKFSKQFIPNSEWIKFKINENQLSLKNKEVLKAIKNKFSIFIHIRRGDYLSPKYIERFKDTCTIEYYKKSIEYIKAKIPNPTFFIFSADMDWTKKNLPLLSESIYIDWNNGKNSPLDMFLMSNCKGGIIANSTFSYWGAKIGVPDKIIIYPSKWINSKEGNPDIFDEKWIKI